MSKSVKDVNEEQRTKYKTLKNKYSDFPIGVAVQVICVAQDFTFFSGKETGIVIRNSGDYLGIIVKFDKPYNKYHKDFNFEPKDLKLITGGECPHCGGKL